MSIVDNAVLTAQRGSYLHVAGVEAAAVLIDRPCTLVRITVNGHGASSEVIVNDVDDTEDIDAANEVLDLVTEDAGARVFDYGLKITTGLCVETKGASTDITIIYR